MKAKEGKKSYNTSDKRVVDALEDISRGCFEFIDKENIANLVARYFETGERFRAKLGLDPTSPDIHIGHTVVINKLAILQKYGADIDLVIGDFTATIGDPSGKSATRNRMTETEVLENAKSYERQFRKVLDFEHVKVNFNSHWLKKLDGAGFLELTAKYNVSRMLERDDFAKRFKNQQSISIIEFLYPLMQGYDSVALKSDVELGGTDQKFNNLVGRHLQKQYGLDKEQSVLLMPILEGLDGVNKMSKSLNNYIGIEESPKDIYAKVLSISDEIMWKYYVLLTQLTTKEIDRLKSDVTKGVIHPKKVKEDLALDIVARFHSKEDAKRAKDEFDNIHSKNLLPSDIKEFSFKENIDIIKVLLETSLEASSSQARRDILAGAVRIDGEKIADIKHVFNQGEYVLQVGKRKFAKLIISN